jgi:peptidoglycan hydrolase-like protein with peptidoglycan-binding domain
MQSIIVRISPGVLLLVVFLLLVGSNTKAHAATPTIAELQAKIVELTKIVEQLRAQLQVQQNSTPSWSRPLGLGMEGEDVRALQRFLNADPVTRIAQSGPGAPGQETNYFGPATLAAVRRFQEQYRDEILMPSGLMSGNGFFGQQSIAHAQRLLQSRARTMEQTVQTPTNNSTRAPEVEAVVTPERKPSRSSGGGGGGSSRNETSSVDETPEVVPEPDVPRTPPPGGVDPVQGEPDAGPGEDV